MQEAKQGEPNLSGWHSDREVCSEERNISRNWVKIEELLPGRNGEIRSAKVKVAGKEDQQQQQQLALFAWP